MQYETNTRKIIARLLREGWTNVGGGRHDKFVKLGHDSIPVPRHSVVSLGVAISIARGAGWSKPKA